jgi:hypothetical protein
LVFFIKATVKATAPVPVPSNNRFRTLRPFDQSAGAAGSPTGKESEGGTNEVPQIGLAAHD